MNKFLKLIILIFFNLSLNAGSGDALVDSAVSSGVALGTNVASAAASQAFINKTCNAEKGCPGSWTATSITCNAIKCNATEMEKDKCLETCLATGTISCSGMDVLGVVSFGGTAAECNSQVTAECETARSGDQDLNYKAIGQFAQIYNSCISEPKIKARNRQTKCRNTCRAIKLLAQGAASTTDQLTNLLNQKDEGISENGSSGVTSEDVNIGVEDENNSSSSSTDTVTEENTDTNLEKEDDYGDSVEEKSSTSAAEDSVGTSSDAETNSSNVSNGGLKKDGSKKDKKKKEDIEKLKEKLKERKEKLSKLNTPSMKDILKEEDENKKEDDKNKVRDIMGFKIDIWFVMSRRIKYHYKKGDIL